MKKSRASRPLFFVYAPPLKGTRPSNRRAVEPPYKGAPSWKCSVYYYWWEYLRRHDGYRQTCESAGRGKYADLYADFGNVHGGDFWDWWTEHAELFAEPPIRHVSVEHSVSTDQNTLTFSVPLENKLSVSMKQIRRLLEPQVQKAARKKTQSLAKYPVATKPVLRTLHEHLSVWDAKQQNPTAHDSELADIARISVNEVVDSETVAELRADDLPTRDLERVIKRRKQLVVQRHLRIAEQYIENVINNKFPLRVSR
jgi:hypothetical protein